MRSGECRPRETGSGAPGAGASAQPHLHNPRKQRKNPAAAKSGERFRKGKWRRERDSNPRFGNLQIARPAPVSPTKASHQSSPSAVAAVPMMRTSSRRAASSSSSGMSLRISRAAASMLGCASACA